MRPATRDFRIRAPPISAPTKSRFESYRKLGHYITARLFDDAYREMLGNDYNMEKTFPGMTGQHCFKPCGHAPARLSANKTGISNR